MNEEGFHSPSHKPYQGIGDPFYLDQKALILHALGQWDEVSVFSYVQYTVNSQKVRLLLLVDIGNLQNNYLEFLATPISCC